MTDKVFAPDYEKDEKGWFIFPRDVTWRRELFPKIAMEHPSKMNMYVCQEIINYVSEAGDTIVDCFGGTGTTAIGALTGRNVVLMELERPYVEIQRETIELWKERDILTGNVLSLQGDNRKLLPHPTDHMIFSPPYANDMMKKGGGALNEEIQKQVDQYTDSKENFGRLNEFFYKQFMDQLYDKVAASVRQDGTVTITHRDRSRSGKRLLFADSIIKSLTTRGFSLLSHNKWKAPGAFQSRVNEARGAMVILDEDILTFIKDK
jgi:predicted RNA methylase